MDFTCTIKSMIGGDYKLLPVRMSRCSFLSRSGACGWTRRGKEGRRIGRILSNDVAPAAKKDAKWSPSWPQAWAGGGAETAETGLIRSTSSSPSSHLQSQLRLLKLMTRAGVTCKWGVDEKNMHLSPFWLRADWLHLYFSHCLLSKSQPQKYKENKHLRGGFKE